MKQSLFNLETKFAVISVNMNISAKLSTALKYSSCKKIKIKIRTVEVSLSHNGLFKLD